MKRSSIQNDKKRIVEELTDAKIVKYYAIIAPQIQGNDTISKFLFIQLVTEIERDELFSKKIFSRN